ncbi:MAG: fimbrillin family protein [Rikenellaceae bacterium]
MKKLILTATTLILIASCQKSELSLETSTEVVFTSGIETRVSGTEWDAGDGIGVFMYLYDIPEVYDENCSNVLYANAEGGVTTGTFTSENPLYYLNSYVDFMAYYPYTEAITASGYNFIVSLGITDQSTAKSLKTQDFMVASTTKCNENNPPVLTYSRQMSRILITINRKVTKEDALVSDISISNLVVDGTYTIDNGKDNSIVAGSTKGTLSLYENDSNVIEAIVIPQSVATAVLTLTVDGEPFSTVIAGTFEANKQNNYTLNIGQDEVILNTETISDWEEEDVVDDLTSEVF